MKGLKMRINNISNSYSEDINPGNLKIQGILIQTIELAELACGNEEPGRGVEI